MNNVNITWALQYVKHFEIQCCWKTCEQWSQCSNDFSRNLPSLEQTTIIYVQRWFGGAIPCNTMQCHTMPYNTIHYHTISYNTIQYHTIPYIIIQRLLCRAIPCNTIQRQGKADHALVFMAHLTSTLWTQPNCSAALSFEAIGSIQPSLSQTKKTLEKSQMDGADMVWQEPAKSISASQAKTNNTMYQVKLWSQS